MENLCEANPSCTATHDIQNSKFVPKFCVFA